MKRLGLAVCISALVLGGCSRQEAQKDGVSTSERLSQAAIELDRKNFGRVIELSALVLDAEPANQQAHYQRTQAFSMTGDIDAALRALESALKSGFRDFQALESNRNLEALRAAPQFPALLSQYQPVAQSAVTLSEKEVSAGDASIKEVNGQQVIRAGDIQITMPKN